MTANAGGPTLTILTVVIEKHYDYITQQIALFDALNPGIDWRLVVVDNASTGAPRLQVADPRCRVLAGFDPSSFPAEGRGSYHHASALNAALEHVQSRFLLVIDPDFFVVRPGWMAEAMAHMQARNLWFFGAPWHYASFRKWRYFPCVHFLMIDLAKADRDRLDFTPAIVEDRRWLASAPAAWLKTHAPLWYERSLVESRRDTGWRLRRAFGSEGRRRSEVIQPILSIERELIHPKYLRSEKNRRIERRLPRRWSFLPAAGTYLDPAQVPGFDRPEIHELNPETFAWKGEPFAFHMRRNMRDKTKGRTEADADREAEVVRGLLDGLTARARVS